MLAMDDELVAVVLVPVIGGLVAIVMVARFYLESRRKTRLADLRAQAAETEARLKALMVQRGMSAEEIERILSTGPARQEFEAEENLDPEGRIVSVLASNGYDGDDIERVLRAARRDGKVPLAAARTVETLANNWTEGKDIERVLLSDAPKHAATA